MFAPASPYYMAKQLRPTSSHFTQTIEAARSRDDRRGHFWGRYELLCIHNYLEPDSFFAFALLKPVAVQLFTRSHQTRLGLKLSTSCSISATLQLTLQATNRRPRGLSNPRTDCRLWSSKPRSGLFCCFVFLNIGRAFFFFNTPFFSRPQNDSRLVLHILYMQHQQHMFQHWRMGLYAAFSFWRPCFGVLQAFEVASPFRTTSNWPRAVGLLFKQVFHIFIYSFTQMECNLEHTQKKIFRKFCQMFWLGLSFYKCKANMYIYKISWGGHKNLKLLIIKCT